MFVIDENEKSIEQISNIGKEYHIRLKTHNKQKETFSGTFL